jgi:hypothetical protein
MGSSEHSIPKRRATSSKVTAISPQGKSPGNGSCASRGTGPRVRNIFLKSKEKKFERHGSKSIPGPCPLVSPTAASFPSTPTDHSPAVRPPAARHARYKRKRSRRRCASACSAARCRCHRRLLLPGRRVSRAGASSPRSRPHRACSPEGAVLLLLLLAYN